MKLIFKSIIVIGTLLAVLTAISFVYAIKVPYFYMSEVPLKVGDILEIMQASVIEETYFKESFDREFVIEENWPIRTSGDPNWWVSSGAYLFSRDGVGSTVVGDLDNSDRWVSRYYRANPTDTDRGRRPQNIFRLVFKKKLLDLSQEVYARILYYKSSQSEYRNASNGILLFNRYQDEFNLYYTGIRVDGQAVVKKKLHGTYYTLGLAPVFDGSSYDRNSNPNVIPLNMWIGIKSEISTDDLGIVHIKVFTDIGKSGNWTLVLEALDDGNSFDATISKPGYAGIRTDFMDVEFDDYAISKK